MGGAAGLSYSSFKYFRQLDKAVSSPVLSALTNAAMMATISTAATTSVLYMASDDASNKDLAESIGKGAIVGLGVGAATAMTLSTPALNDVIGSPSYLVSGMVTGTVLGATADGVFNDFESGRYTAAGFMMGTAAGLGVMAGDVAAGSSTVAQAAIAPVAGYTVGRLAGASLGVASTGELGQKTADLSKAMGYFGLAAGLGTSAGVISSTGIGGWNSLLAPAAGLGIGAATGAGLGQLINSDEGAGTGAASGALMGLGAGLTVGSTYGAKNIGWNNGWNAVLAPATGYTAGGLIGTGIAVASDTDAGIGWMSGSMIGLSAVSRYGGHRCIARWLWQCFIFPGYGRYRLWRGYYFGCGYRLCG